MLKRLKKYLEESGDFGRASHQYFSYYFAPPPHSTLRYPQHAPDEKAYFSVNTNID